MTNTASDLPLSALPGYGEVATIVAERSLHHFSSVVALLYHRQAVHPPGGVWPSVELVMAEPVAPHRKLGFRFYGVRDMRVTGWDTIEGLYFQRIDERGWEDARFEVGDYELGCIHFYCSAIAVFDPVQVG